MAHEIFISYSTKHRDLTRQLAAVIEHQYGTGSVWWDQELESRASYSEQIKIALEQARVVVVIWTAGAIVSDYVYAEAVRAKEGGKLVNVRPADMAFRDIPEPFNIHHIDEAEDHQRILKTIGTVMAGVPTPTRMPLHELFFRQHGVRLIDPKRHPARDPSTLSPTELLQPKFEVVPFLDLNDSKPQLLAWCKNSAREVAGRLVHGPGGLGKTRLMIDVATALRAEGWMAGFLDRPHEQVEATLRQRTQALDQLMEHGTDTGFLMIMDYAEGRSDEIKAIAQRLALRPAGTTRPIRLVLLTRGAGDWWTSLYDENPTVERLFRRDARSADVMALPPISTGEQRLHLFVKSVEAMAPLLHGQGFALPTKQPDVGRLLRIEAGGANARPLVIQMEALLYLASAAPESEAVGIDALLRKVLGIERDHWRKLIGALDDDRARDMSRAVAQVTAVQGVNGTASAERLLMADQFYEGTRTARVQVDPVMRNLNRVYGLSNGGISHLEPDLIGEHHVASLADVELIEGCLRWISDEPVAVRGKKRRDLLTVLQRATRPEHGRRANERAATLLDHLIVEHGIEFAEDIVAVAIDTPGDLAARLEGLANQLSTETVEVLYSAMPQRSLILDAAATAFAEARVSHEDDSLSLFQKPSQLVELGRRLSHLGRREEALAATQEAVDRYRSLAKDRPDAFLPGLARSLNNLGNELLEVGRWEEALTAMQEAVEVIRPLAKERSDALLPDLATLLSNVSNAFYELGRHGEALASIQEAVDIGRLLVKDRPEVFVRDLAMKLDNYGRSLGYFGRWEEALTASQEAVDINRWLSKDRPDAFLPDLVRSLNNLSVALGKQGRWREALEAMQEATEICRSLAKDRPGAFLPNLAKSLMNSGTYFSKLDRGEEGLANTQEATDIYRLLAKDRPDAFLPDLARCLSALGASLGNGRRHQEALAAIQEAVELYRSLAKDRPDAFLPKLAQSLNNLSTDLGEHHRWEEALAATQEAVNINWSLAKDRHQAVMPELSRSLNSLGVMLSKLGRREEALAATQKAVELYRLLAKDRPNIFLRELARSLSNIGDRLSKLGRREEALAAAQEAVDIIRSLANDRPDAFLRLLADELNNLAYNLLALARADEGIAVSREATSIWRNLAQHDPELYLPQVVGSLDTTADILVALGDVREADATAREGLSILQPFIERDPYARSVAQELAKKLLS